MSKIRKVSLAEKEFEYYKILDSMDPNPARKEIGNAEIMRLVNDKKWNIEVFCAGQGPGAVTLKKNGVGCDVIEPEAVAGRLKDFADKLFLERESWLDDMTLTYADAEKIVKGWIARAHRFPLPKPVAFKSDDSLAMRKMDFDPIRCGLKELKKRAPEFVSIMRRIKSSEDDKKRCWELAKIWAARIGSLYDPAASRKQCVWMYGPQNGGKSAIATFIRWLVGNNAADLSMATITRDSYWKAGLAGKRVVSIMEAATAWIDRPEFKAITGDKQHTVRQIYGKEMNVELTSMFFFYSNEIPEISRDEATMFRVIPVYMPGIPDDDRVDEQTFLGRLQEAAPYIIGYCQEIWDELRQPDGTIKVDLSYIEHHVDEGEAEMQSFVESVIEKTQSKNEGINCDEFRQMAEWHGYKGKQFHRVVQILKRDYDSKKVRQSSGKRLRLYPGIKWTEKALKEFNDRKVKCIGVVVQFSPNLVGGPESNGDGVGGTEENQRDPIH